MLGLLQQRRSRERLARALAGVAEPELLAHAPDVLWMIRVVGTVALAKRVREQAAPRRRGAGHGAPPAQLWPPPPDDRQRIAYCRRVVDALGDLIKGMTTDVPPYLVHLVSRNRRAEVSVWRSSLAVKADAATRLFHLSCRDLTWAVVEQRHRRPAPGISAPRRRGPTAAAPGGP